MFFVGHSEPIISLSASDLCRRNFCFQLRNGEAKSQIDSKLSKVT